MQALHWLKKFAGKKLVYGLAAAAVGLCFIGGLMFKAPNQPTAAAETVPFVRTAVIGAADAAQGYTYSGEVRGRYESQLAFQVTGKLVKRNVQLGSTVNAGDILMQIDPKDLQQTVNSTSAQVDSAESQLRLAESNLSRYRQLYAQNAISRAQLDQYQNAYAVAQAAVQQASAQYAQGANQLDYSLLYADTSGVIASISAEAGQVISAGQTVLTIVRDGEREVEISVPENRVEELRQAAKLTASFWALANVSVNGRIREIAPMADPASRTFKVRIGLVNPPPAVKLGMTASVTVAADARQTMTIPLAAIYQTGDKPAVWLVTADVLVLRPIETGSFGNGSIQVVSGLQPGDRIVIAGVHTLKQGQKVKLAGETL
jgi:RND family efflux transporter MFP subunit